MFLPLVPIILVVLFIIGIYFYFRMKQRNPEVNPPFRLSHLVCPNCGFEFDYVWVPGMSFTSIRWFGSRFFSCPRCGVSSWFNIRDTEVDPAVHHCDTRIGPQ